MNKPISGAGLGRILALLAVVSLFLPGISVRAQSPYLQEPNRQQLLNGLQVLIWQKPGDQNVFLRMRVHSGAAYDLAGKAGMMALLGDVLFPDAETRQYFTEELGGRLEVNTDYDALTITMSGRVGAFERMVEILRNAVVATPLSPENVARLRDARVKVLQETSMSPSMIADRAIALRLFREFPYGRPASGSAETVGRIDRGDLMLARERFLNADNATLVIAGGLDERRTMRTLRQLLGNWRKSDRLVPATFRQPEAPDLRTLIINQPGGVEAEVRLATRGLARADREYLAGRVMAVIARERWQAALADVSRAPVFARQEAHKVPGMFVMGTSVKNTSAAKAISAARNVINSLLASPPTAIEIERARNEVGLELTKQVSEPTAIVDLWLDAETFKFSPLAQQANSLRDLTPKNVHDVALRLFKDNSLATVILGNYDELKPSLSPADKVELLGDSTVNKPASQPPAKKP